MTTSPLSTANRITFVVPLLYSAGSLIYVNSTDILNELIFKLPINLYNLTVQLRDKDGIIINTNGSQ